MRKAVSLAERMDNLTSPEPNTGCWIWMGQISPRGYGRIWVNEIKASALAHRINYQRFKGCIPEGLVVRHTCDNRWCVNPDHLITGTNADNTNDALTRHPERFGNGGVVGEKHGRAILNEKQVLEIRRLCSDGMPFYEIAKMFGISYANARKVVNRGSWKHI